MTNQLQQHIVATFGTKQRILAEAIEETLLKRFLWQHSVTSGVSGHLGRYNICKLFSDVLITYIAVQSVITDSVKSLRPNVLNHTSDELKGRQGFVFNLSCFVVTIPVADRFAVISFNSANRNRRRNNIFCQVFSQSLSSGWYIAGLKESDKAFGIISPCSVDVSFNGRIGNIIPEHFQEMILPFSVHHVVRDVGDIFPLFQRINSSCGHEDMKMGIVMAGTTCGLENNDVSDVELYAGASVENIFETGITCPHERTEQFGVTIKPGSKELRHGQDHMAVSDTRQETPSDEVGPLVSIDLGTRQAKAGFAGEGNAAYFSAVAASVLNEAHLFWIAAVEHFLDSVVVVGTVKAWTKLFKLIPMIVENLFERVFVNTFHGCSLRTTIAELTKQVEERIIPLCISS
jgi:hypothetical protein